MKKTKATNGEIKIEKGIPMPMRAPPGLQEAITSMGVGDSFRIEKTRYGSIRALASMNKVSIRTRTEDDDYIRVWRVL
jgi:hypothetical protein